jgi:hypothetical protein
MLSTRNGELDGVIFIDRNENMMGRSLPPNELNRQKWTILSPKMKVPERGRAKIRGDRLPN